MDAGDVPGRGRGELGCDLNGGPAAGKAVQKRVRPKFLEVSPAKAIDKAQDDVFILRLKTIQREGKAGAAKEAFNALWQAGKPVSIIIGFYKSRIHEWIIQQAKMLQKRSFFFAKTQEPRGRRVIVGKASSTLVVDMIN